MSVSIYLAFVIAIISPFIFGLMNVIDKFVVSHRVKKPLSFTIVAGMVNLLIGIILALCLSWNGIQISDFVYPVLVGILFGSQFFLYYYLMSKEDASNLVGLIYFYPIIVAVLSFLFINEKLSLLSYFGMALILLGVIMLSVRMNHLRVKVSLWMTSVFILIIAFYEFFMKVATTNLSEYNGTAVSMIFIGLTIMLGLFHRKTREGVAFEMRNFKWAMLTESLTFLGVLTTYIPMALLPATFVASVGAMQPLSVLFLEYIFNWFGGNISKDRKFLPKFIAISLIVIGVAIMYLMEIA